MFIGQILSSKKGLASIIGVIVVAAGKFGMHWDAETIGLFLAPIIGYVWGQGRADTGKEAAKIQAEAASLKEAISANDAAADKALEEKFKK